MRLHCAVLLPTLLCAGCGSGALGPPQDSPADTAATPVRFEDYFNLLAVEDSGTGQRGIYDLANGFRFSRKARLQLAYVALRPSTLRVVVESRTTGEAAGNWIREVPVGTGVLVLGSFPRDLYLLHAYVGIHPRIASIPFAAE